MLHTKNAGPRIGCPPGRHVRSLDGRVKSLPASRWVLGLSVEVAPRGVVAQPAVLHKNDGELRTRRPREGVASPSREFLLKIGPKTNGSQHLLVFSEEMPPGAAIPRHR